MTSVTDRSRFANVEISPSLAYVVSGWLDLDAEFLAGFTNEQDGSNTTEVTERLGVRLHILSRLIQAREARRGAEREQQPKRRGTISTLIRLEHRDLFSTESPNSASWRIRDRVELAYPLNRTKLTNDGTAYLTWDGEAYMPISEDPQQGVINQFRMRTGVGYRRSFTTRFELLYVWTMKKSSDTNAFATDSQAIDFRVKLAF